MKINQGFTLIEVMIVVAIIGLLAAIGIPQYSDYVIRSRIPAATSALADMSVRMEQYFQDNRTYVGACVAGTAAPLPAETTTFVFTCPTLAATTYDVVATGKGSMANFVYHVTPSGKSTTSAPTGWATNTGCWVTSRGGC